MITKYLVKNTKHQGVIDNTTKAVSQSHGEHPWKTRNQEQHAQLSQNHGSHNPFEVWVSAIEFLDLRILF